MNRSVILHFYSLGHGCAVEVARCTKIPVHTVSYNMVKIGQQGNAVAMDDHAKFQRTSIFQLVSGSENDCKRNSAESRATLWFEYVQMDNATSSLSDGL